MSTPRLGCFVLSITSPGYQNYMKLKGFSNWLFFLCTDKFFVARIKREID